MLNNFSFKLNLINLEIFSDKNDEGIEKYLFKKSGQADIKSRSKGSGSNCDIDLVKK